LDCLRRHLVGMIGAENNLRDDLAELLARTHSRMARTSRISQEQTMPLSRTPLVVGSTLCLLWIASVSPVRGATKFASHPPMRPLPVALNRPLEKGPAYFVDPVKGNDASVGSQDKPWKTVAHAV